jgi:hypothetical protein
MFVEIDGHLVVNGKKVEVTTERDPKTLNGMKLDG